MLGIIYVGYDFTDKKIQVVDDTQRTLNQHLQMDVDLFAGLLS